MPDESERLADGLVALGWSPFFERQRAGLGESLTPMRVAVAHGARYELLGASGAIDAVPSGRLQHASASGADVPTVGDWVAVRDNPHGPPHVVVHLFERRTCFVRKAAGRRSGAQVVAANVDVALLVLALGADFNVRRLERYLAATLASGARPVVVLGKADLCADPTPFLEQIWRVAPAAPAIVVSALRGDGLGELGSIVARGTTVALLGSSGVGKSALVNRLLGADVQRVRAVRAHDERGRHTTTHRELFVVGTGGLVIDTPGMRELGLWSTETDVGGFDDVDVLAEQCRFADCRHEQEPGCRVRDAIEAGLLSVERLVAKRKLAREHEHHRQRAESGARPDPRARAEAKARWRDIARRTRSSPKR